MNYAEVISSLFGGAAGRTVADLARRRARGETATDVASVAATSAVVPQQAEKVLVRLALLGLVGFPEDGRFEIVVDHVVWEVLVELSHPRERIAALVRRVVDEVTSDAGPSVAVTAVAVAGPVWEGTARAYPDGLTLGLVAPRGLADETVLEISRAVARATGNTCDVRVLADLGSLSSPSGPRWTTVD